MGSTYRLSLKSLAAHSAISARFDRLLIESIQIINKCDGCQERISSVSRLHYQPLFGKEAHSPRVEKRRPDSRERQKSSLKCLQRIKQVKYKRLAYNYTGPSFPVIKTIRTNVLCCMVRQIACEQILERLKPYQMENPKGTWEDWVR